MLVGAPEDHPDIEYASGFRAVDPVLYMRQGTWRGLVVSSLEYGRARREARVDEVLSLEQLCVGGGRPTFGEAAIALSRRRRVRRVSVPGVFPLGVARRMEAAGIKVALASVPLFPEREIKTPEEIARIRESQQAAVIAMRTAIGTIAASEIGRHGGLRWRGQALTAELVRGVIDRVLLEHRCVARDTIVAGGPVGADPHARGAGPLRAHEPIVIDIFPQHLDHGYWGDLTRTVVRGEASPRLRALYQAVRAAQQAALDLLRAGVDGARVHRRVEREFVGRGFARETRDGVGVGFIHGTGHGVGLAVHEGPSLSRLPQRLQAGNVVTVEPGLYYPDCGGIRIEDTVVVTRAGWRPLAPCEKRFEY